MLVKTPLVARAGASTAATLLVIIWLPSTSFVGDINQVIAAALRMSTSFHVTTKVAREMLSYPYRTYCANTRRET